MKLVMAKSILQPYISASTQFLRWASAARASKADDERFSWSNLAYIGRHWDSILESNAADAKLSKLTREEMEDLLKGVLVPECTAGVLHVPYELYTPFILGADLERYFLDDLSGAEKMHVRDFHSF